MTSTFILNNNSDFKCDKNSNLFYFLRTHTLFAPYVYDLFLFSWKSDVRNKRERLLILNKWCDVISPSFVTFAPCMHSKLLLLTTCWCISVPYIYRYTNTEYVSWMPNGLAWTTTATVIKYISNVALIPFRAHTHILHIVKSNCCLYGKCVYNYKYVQIEYHVFGNEKRFA